MSKKTGYVLWWDESSGEGMIYNPWEKETLYVHWSAIKTSQKSIVKEINNLEKYQPVEFTVYQNLYMKQVASIWPLVFDYSLEDEHKLNHLMNRLFENGDEFIFKLAEIYFKKAA